MNGYTESEIAQTKAMYHEAIDAAWAVAFSDPEKWMVPLMDQSMRPVYATPEDGVMRAGYNISGWGPVALFELMTDAYQVSEMMAARHKEPFGILLVSEWAPVRVACLNLMIFQLDQKR